MKYAEFKAKVDLLLGAVRRTVGGAGAVQAQIDQWVRLGIGELQWYIPYYRRGIKTTFEHDDLTPDGWASRGELPAAAKLREIYHIKTGSVWARRPLHRYGWSNRHDLISGVVTLGKCPTQFYFAIDPRDGARTFWAYPLVTAGYAVQIVWDAILERSGEADYADTDEVPFDGPMALAVRDYVKKEISMEFDRDPIIARELDGKYILRRAALNTEVEERLRMERVNAEAGGCGAGCGVGCRMDVAGLINNAGQAVAYGPVCACGCVFGVTSTLATTAAPSASSTSSVTLEPPQAEWVMVGCSGERACIADTIAVATAIKAVDPQFMVHLGDGAIGTHLRPTETGDEPADQIEATNGGARHLLRDLLLNHYWNLLPANFYLAFGPHDLETDYGAPLLDVLDQPRTLIGDTQRASNQLWYTFARGDVRFIVLNSGRGDFNDDNLQADMQMAFVSSTIAAAAEAWVVVAIHRPAYTSDATAHPGSSVVRDWTNQFRALGVDLVVTGEGRNYERLMDSTGLIHVNCGTGGRGLQGSAAQDLPAGSQFFYSAKHGFLRFTADETRLAWEFRTVDGEVIDRMELVKSATEVVAPATIEGSSVTGLVTDSTNNLPLAGVKVVCGSATYVTGNEGTYEFTGLHGSNVVIEAEKSDYYPYTHSVALLAGEATEWSFSMDPNVLAPLADLNIRIELAWGETPKDLDAHLLTPEIEGSIYHIYYSNRCYGQTAVAPYAQQDRDATDGFGPETITIAVPQPGTYRYWVHNYKDEQGNTGELTASAAVVKVYNASGLVQTIAVPTSGTGDYWNVLTVDGATGAITVINEIQAGEPI